MLRRRLFANHWSQLFGEVAFYSFAFVLVSGVFLTFFYDPSVDRVIYDGSYTPLSGVEMSKALESTLAISFDVQGGMLMRQLHHWASLIMVAAILIHLAAAFFTGAFSKPRELRWVVAFLILVMTMAAGFTGAALPDDLLSNTSLVIMDGVMKSIPVVGTWISALVFGGPFPGDVLAQFYPLHVIALPAVVLWLFVVAGVLALVHKPAIMPRRGRESRGIPLRLAMARSGGRFFVVGAISLVVAATVTVNPIWNYGPADPGHASAGAGPLWYLAFLDGALRLVPPGWEFELLGYTVTLAVLVPVGIVSLFLLALAVYPFLEAWITGDRRDRDILDRPRNAPTRTAIGVAGILFYAVLWATAGADTIAVQFGLSIEATLWTMRVLVVAAPLVGFLVARRVCAALQRKDADVVAHGFETGRIVRSPDGGYVEVHQPLEESERARLADAEPQRALVLRPDDDGRIRLAERLRVRLSRAFYGRERGGARDVSADPRALDQIRRP